MIPAENQFVTPRHTVLIVVLSYLGSAVLGAIRLHELSFWYDEIISIDSVRTGPLRRNDFRTNASILCGAARLVDSSR